METGIHFAGAILKFTSKSAQHHSAPQTTILFVVPAFVLYIELTMDKVYPKPVDLESK